MVYPIRPRLDVPSEILCDGLVFDASVRFQTDGAIYKALAEHETASSTCHICVACVIRVVASLTGRDCIRLALWCGHQIHSTNPVVNARRGNPHPKPGGKEMGKRRLTFSSETLLTHSQDPKRKSEDHLIDVREEKRVTAVLAPHP
jgi:hypothetical protein